MVYNKSLDESKIIAALLHDIHLSYGVVFPQRAYRLTLKKVLDRLDHEGIGFLTKTLPRLGKHLDKVLACQHTMNSTDLGFDPQDDSELPRFLGEFFNRVLAKDGAPLPDPDANCVAVIRQVCYLFYKYKLPYSHDQEQQVVSKFERTEDDLRTISEQVQQLDDVRSQTTRTRRKSFSAFPSRQEVVREARILLSNIFSRFDPTDIYPRHGPGVVSTKEKLWDKYQWTNVSSRITSVYPLDAYFYASLGHLCDDLDKVRLISDEDRPAKVILVPKDSRGPRLISCEPVDFQWIQQGLSRAIVKLVESHPLTRETVNFTDQTPNRNVALMGSRDGRYSTIDLNEASDRVSLDLVRLLFPEHIIVYLEACRSSCTELPDGRVIKLRKYAPMGSALCFPVLALTIWALLTAGAPDAHTKDRMLVYGDDVIVPTAYAENAMELLESFGLKINRDKSCISGLFRESCGMDAYRGVDVTPVRLRTVWSSHRDPGVYASWIAYANSFFDRRYYTTYDVIVRALHSVYGAIADDSISLKRYPSLREVDEDLKPKKSRINKDLQKSQYYVWDLKPKKIKRDLNSWSQLLRYFAEVGNDRNRDTSHSLLGTELERSLNGDFLDPFSTSQYTSRRTSMLVRRWR
jgi:hypothetical protein